MISVAAVERSTIANTIRDVGVVIVLMMIHLTVMIIVHTARRKGKRKINLLHDMTKRNPIIIIIIVVEMMMMIKRRRNTSIMIIKRKSSHHHHSEINPTKLIQPI